MEDDGSEIFDGSTTSYDSSDEQQMISDYDLDEEIIEDVPNPEKVQTHLDLGMKVFHEFPILDEYGDYELRDIFDDGLEDDDDSDVDSDISTNYEDIDEPEMVRVITIEGSPKPAKESTDEFEDDNISGEWDSKSEASTAEESMTTKDEAVAEGSASNSAPVECNNYTVIPGPSAMATLPPKSFAELQKQKHELVCHKTYSSSDCVRWEILSLEETKKSVEQALLQKERELEIAIGEENEAEALVTSSLVYAGISLELQEAYEAFCDSLTPEFGQRDGFSITSSKESGRWTAQIVDGQFIRVPPSEWDYVVEFWPLKSPEPAMGSESTWGELYPELYSLAVSAVRNGSEAAMELLISLPDMNSSFTGGWLFDYQNEPTLAHELVKSKRWRYRSAHKIDAPVTTEAKRNRVELMAIASTHSQKDPSKKPPLYPMSRPLRCDKNSTMASSLDRSKEHLRNLGPEAMLADSECGSDFSQCTDPYDIYPTSSGEDMDLDDNNDQNQLIETSEEVESLKDFSKMHAAEFFPHSSSSIIDGDCHTSADYEELEEQENENWVFVASDSVVSSSNYESSEETDHTDSDVWDTKLDSTPKDEVEEIKHFPTTRRNALSLASTPEPTDTPSETPPPTSPKTFSELKKEKYKTHFHSKHSTPSNLTHSLRWEIFELSEIKAHVPIQLLSKEQLSLALSQQETATNAHFRSPLSSACISQELFKAYEEFCESLVPKKGQKGGHELGFREDHWGYYPVFDPGFRMLRQFTDAKEKGEEEVFVVEFWPLKYPEPVGKTWGELFPKLYHLASLAVQAGSNAAMEMLIALPDKNVSSAGAWLFDMEYEGKLGHEVVKSRHWVFRSAHKIDEPMTVEEKGMYVERDMGMRVGVDGLW
ncbi:hypothetical protein G7Y89_g12795 [Cudoniella acicularis]|uniref:Uncharacterized protein n=1 Tax=Cudoniella acicularis TaxID=354080 RepID=A0A8H4R9E8_9HELO|nr:hypothetical protein G7Y89_g12795 [Cudoniella acicularis]